MKAETKLEKIMELVDAQKRYSALFSFCMVDVLPHCELWETAHAEFMRLHALGYRLF